jgi:hypothetical protein
MAFLGIGASKSNSKTNTTQDPWAPIIPYLTQGAAEGQDTYEAFKNLDPQESAALQQYTGGQLANRSYADPYLLNIRTNANKLEQGVYDPSISAVGPISSSVLGHVGDVRAKTIKAATSNLAQARAAQGVLDPTGALSKAMSGKVDNPAIQAMADASTRAQQRAYGDAVQDASDSLSRSVLPAIRSGAFQAGGYGGSRQGIAEGLAISDQQKNLNRNARDLGIASGDATANLYGQEYDAAQNRAAQTASDLNTQAGQNSQYNASNVQQANVQNASNDLQASLANQQSQLAQQGNQLDLAKTNANLGLQNNSQEMQRAAQAAGNVTTGAQTYYGSDAAQDNNFNQMMTALGMPRSTAQNAYASWMGPLVNMAGLGGSSQSKTSGSSMNVSAGIGK